MLAVIPRAAGGFASSVRHNRLRPSILERRVGEAGQNPLICGLFFLGPGEHIRPLPNGASAAVVRPGRGDLTSGLKRNLLSVEEVREPTLRRKASFLSSSEGRSPGRPSTFRVRRCRPRTRTLITGFRVIDCRSRGLSPDALSSRTSTGRRIRGAAGSHERGVDEPGGLQSGVAGTVDLTAMSL